MKLAASWVAVALVLGGLPARAAPDGGQEPTVLTFRGLLELEKDPRISDEQKLKEWQAFVTRTKEQLDYAQKAVERWTIAPRVKAFEAAEADEQKPELSAREKIERWKSFVQANPRTPEAKLADKRIGEWSAVEARRLADAALEVERSGVNKLERIGAHKKVSEWAPATSEARASAARVAALALQVFQEAQNLDRTRGVDAESKAEAWRDVLQGAPTPPQRALAQQRLAVLQKN